MIDKQAVRLIAIEHGIFSTKDNQTSQFGKCEWEVSNEILLPDLNLSHLVMLSDDTGIFQHAIYCVADRFHGYCVDDNARALIAAVNYCKFGKSNIAMPLVHRYLSFIHSAFNSHIGKFRNFMSFDRKWLDHVGSDDVQGRSLWALGFLIRYSPTELMVELGNELFLKVITSVEKLTSPRAWALTILGAYHYLKHFPDDADDEVCVREIVTHLATTLLTLFEKNKSEDWPWLEDSLNYDNARLPQALILAGEILHKTKGDAGEKMIKQGLDSLDWLCSLQIDEDGMVSLVGNDGWCLRSGKRARFDQQPIDAQALIGACADAYLHTKNEIWRSRAYNVLGWFMGNNELDAVLVDGVTGGCCDGLHSCGVNLNQGAESTLAWLLSLMRVYELYDFFDGVK